MYKLAYSNFGQQCCYDHNGAYTTQEIPAGSADFEYPMDSYLLHQSSDYFPYRACCIDSKDDDFCKMYYEKRPKDSGNPNVSCQDVVPRTGIHT